MAKIEEVYGVDQSKFFFSHLLKARQKIFNKIKDNISESDTIIDIGTTPVKLKHENFFLNHYELKEKITCLSNQDLTVVREIYPNLKTITGDGRDTKLASNSFDISISNATLEHVGNFSNQVKMIQNITCLTKKYFLITTPNRFFPIDFHTKLPFLHMLPKNIHRMILTLLNLKEYAKEENLNLLGYKDLNKLINVQKNDDFIIKIFKIKLFGLTSNLLILGKKYQ